MSSGVPEISKGEEAATQETDADQITPLSLISTEPETDDVKITKLSSFLRSQFPGEVNRTNRPVPEHPVDVAIRLLTGLTTQGHVARCREPYCNRPSGHGEPHAWVHYSR
jgi:hypothetical protein